MARGLTTVLHAVAPADDSASTHFTTIVYTTLVLRYSAE
jgi:hypothetical protein